MSDYKCRECGANLEKCERCGGDGNGFIGSCAYCKGTGQQCTRDKNHNS